MRGAWRMGMDQSWRPAEVPRHGTLAEEKSYQMKGSWTCQDCQLHDCGTF